MNSVSVVQLINKALYRSLMVEKATGSYSQYQAISDILEQLQKAINLNDKEAITRLSSQLGQIGIRLTVHDDSVLSDYLCRIAIACKHTEQNKNLER